MTKAMQMKFNRMPHTTGAHRWNDRSSTVALPGFASSTSLQSVPLGSAYRLVLAALVLLPILTDALDIVNRSSFGATLRAIPLRSRFREYEYSLVNGRERVNH